MRLLFSSERVLTHVAADACREPSCSVGLDRTDRRSAPASSAQTPAPRLAGLAVDTADPAWGQLEALVRVAVAGEPDEIARHLTPDATGWSPASAYGSRADAMALVGRGMAWLQVDVLQITRLLWSAPFAFAEWQLTASHREAMLIRDDLLVEPSGRTVDLAGATALVLQGDRISSAHVYFDDATLIEELLFPVR